MAEEVNEIRKSLHSWKKNRSSRLEGKTTKLVYVKLSHREIDPLSPTDLTILPSYHNSPQLNKVLDSLHRNG